MSFVTFSLVQLFSVIVFGSHQFSYFTSGMLTIFFSGGLLRVLVVRLCHFVLACSVSALVRAVVVFRPGVLVMGRYLDHEGGRGGVVGVM